MPKATPSERARRQRLKVYRTEAGFHDAYVAAPSMKAALKAWGARGDLFHQHAAQLVTDPELTAAPLSRPGEIVLRPRGDAVAHMRAAGVEVKPVKPAKAPKPKRPRPPSRDRLDTAHGALEAQRKADMEELAALDREIDDLRKRRDQTAAAQRKRIARLSERAASAQEAYDAALAEWSAED